MIDIKFSQVSKKYRIQQEFDGHSSSSPLARRLRNLRKCYEDFWALREVSFEARRGEALGIIGPNGAGKSTILKLLSRITAPTSGEIAINGRLSALIEIGSGFHPELTGRENIYLNGSILGMRRRDITKKLDSIIDFAGVSQFIDTPVKRYSSGMYVRLGFSISAHLNPDILLLDEVLAVGDAAFQSRCFKRISELKHSGTTIVFISHDLRSVARICDRALLLEAGEILAGGSPEDVIAQYQRASAGLAQSVETSREEAEITSVSLYDCGRREAAAFYTGYPINIRLEFIAREKIEDAAFELFLHSGGWSRYCHLSTEASSEIINLEPGKGAIDFSCEALGLQPGLYHVSAAIIRRGQPPGSAIDWRSECAALIVEPGKVARGSFYMPFKYEVTDSEPLGSSACLDSSFGEVAARLQEKSAFYHRHGRAEDTQSR